MGSRKRALATALTAAAALIGAAGPVAAQDTNIMTPVDSLEQWLRFHTFEIIDERGSRFEGDRTSRVALSFPTGELMIVKWAPAPRGGEEFNNVPRYEVAAYELQKLFLDESEYVVPPTVLRALPVHWYRRLNERARPTFRRTESVLVALQYWLYNVTDEDFWDEDRFVADSTYARHFGNFNTLTYLINHRDTNRGNFLISKDPANPRVFSVDNGVAFASDRSDRGDRWRRLRVDRLPAGTVARLRALTHDDLTRQLQTLAEFRVREDGTLERVEPGPVLDDRGSGIRRGEGRIQLGLTRREIGQVWDRIQHLLDEVDEGAVEVF